MSETATKWQVVGISPKTAKTGKAYWNLTLVNSLSEKITPNVFDPPTFPINSWIECIAYKKGDYWNIKEIKGVSPPVVNTPQIIMQPTPVIEKPNWDQINAQKQAQIEKAQAERKAENDALIKALENERDEHMKNTVQLAAVKEELSLLRTSNNILLAAITEFTKAVTKKEGK